MKHKAFAVLIFIIYIFTIVLFLLPTMYIVISSIQTGSLLTLQPNSFSLDRYLTLFLAIIIFSLPYYARYGLHYVQLLGLHV